MNSENMAKRLCERHGWNAADLMEALDAAEYDADQDWENGCTTWKLPDGSKVRICGTDVEVILGETK